MLGFQKYLNPINSGMGRSGFPIQESYSKECGGLLSMKESKLHLTTSSILPEADLCQSLRRRLKARRSRLASEAGKLYGFWRVLPDAIPLTTKGIQVWCECMHPNCGIVRLVRLSDLRKGATSSCGRHHTQNQYYQSLPEEIHTVLRRRYNRIQVATDQNGKNPAFAAYRRKGIENRFSSAEEFVRYVVETMPMDSYLGVEIDRIDNSGHYEPGNLRIVTREENAQNRDCNVVVVWRGEKMSATKFTRVANLRFHPSSVIEMIRNGASPEQIIAHQYEKQPGVSSSKRARK